MFEGVSHAKLLLAVVLTQQRPTVGGWTAAGYPAALSSLVVSMWDAEPSKRPLMSEVISRLDAIINDSVNSGQSGAPRSPPTAPPSPTCRGTAVTRRSSQEQ